MSFVHQALYTASQQMTGVYGIRVRHNEIMKGYDGIYYGGISFPAPVKQIDKLEVQNTH